MIEATGDGAIESVDRIDSSKLLLEGGEVLISKLNPRKARVLIAQPHTVPTVCSGEFIPLVPQDDVDRQYLWWRLRSNDVTQELGSQVRSVTRSHQRIDPIVLTKLWIDLPAIDAQWKIAAYLDARCREIDELLLEQRKQEELLMEHQQSMITELVYSEAGLRRTSSRTSVPLIPLKRAAQLLTSNVDKKTVDDEMLVRLCNYVDVYKNEVITAELEMMTASASAEQIARLGLRGGDVIFTKDSETADDIAVPAYVPNDLPGVVCGYHLAIARTFPEIMVGRFLYWCLRSRRVMDQFEFSANGVTRYGLSQAATGSVLVPAPELEEQRRVAERLDDLNGQVVRLLAELERSRELLNERMAAIITATVTGQMEVA